MGNAQASARGGGRAPPTTAAANGPLREGLLDQIGAAPNGNEQAKEKVPVPNEGNGTIEDQGAEPTENHTPPTNPEPSKPPTPLLPIPEDYMIEMLPTYANTALYGLTTINLLVANTVGPLAEAGLVQSLLYMCPYTYIPLGVVSAVLATVATKCRRFAGVASGFMLVQLLYVIALGGLTTIIRMSLSFTFQELVSGMVLGFSIVICVMIFVVWSILFPYPKCISLWNLMGRGKPEGAAAALSLSAEATEAAGVADRAARDAVAIAKVATSDAKLAKKAADEASAAEGAVGRASDAERDAAEASTKAKQAAQGASGYAIAAEKAADEAAERCKRAQIALENAEKSTQAAQVAEDKARLLSDAVNKV